MDTRNKIVTVADARQISGPVLLATGYFDVLREEHVRELQTLADQQAGQEHGSPCHLMVAVLPLESALLDQRARAELVAGLRMVDYVIAASDSEVADLIQALHPRKVLNFDSEHARLARELLERVHRLRENPATTR